MSFDQIHAKVAVWRQRARDGTLTPEEMKEAIVFLRGAREAAVPRTTKKAATPLPSGDDLLKDLMG